ncbi:hypothetical protein CEXT_123891 [Caerostris extrusa]|uniref:Uncharacterized protein n=1 Tax=Caerostris extrusa TaxID=172846 RepID=A0AAV4M577_CAEEX|nr:hypothetical protein CEXT_123891 [Caerostris extrusa]
MAINQAMGVLCNLDVNHDVLDSGIHCLLKHVWEHQHLKEQRKEEKVWFALEYQLLALKLKNVKASFFPSKSSQTTLIRNHRSSWLSIKLRVSFCNLDVNHDGLDSRIHCLLKHVWKHPHLTKEQRKGEKRLVAPEYQLLALKLK